MVASDEVAEALALTAKITSKSVKERRAARREIDRLNRGRVYFIECCGCIKLGYTEDSAGARMANLQPGCPFQLKLWAVAKGQGRDERALHKQFRAQRMHCEWFRMCPDDLDALRVWVREHSGEIYE
jgi:hypothetical protein